MRRALLRALGVIVALAIAAVVAFTSLQGRDALEVHSGARVELQQGRLADARRNDPDDDRGARRRADRRRVFLVARSVLAVADDARSRDKGACRHYGPAVVRRSRLFELRAQSEGVARSSAFAAPACRNGSARSWCRPRKWSRCAKGSAARASASSSRATCSCRWKWTTRPGTS